MKRFILSSLLIGSMTLFPLLARAEEAPLEPKAAQESTDTAKSHLSEWVIIGVVTALAATVILLVAFDKGHDAQAH